MTKNWTNLKVYNDQIRNLCNLYKKKWKKRCCMIDVDKMCLGILGR